TSGRLTIIFSSPRSLGEHRISSTPACNSSVVRWRTVVVTSYPPRVFDSPYHKFACVRDAVLRSPQAHIRGDWPTRSRPPAGRGCAEPNGATDRRQRDRTK